MIRAQSLGKLTTWLPLADRYQAGARLPVAMPLHTRRVARHLVTSPDSEGSAGKSPKDHLFKAGLGVHSPGGGTRRGLLKGAVMRRPAHM